MPTSTPVIVDQEYLEDIADAIRAQNGTNDTYTPAQMAAAITAISGGGGGGGSSASRTLHIVYSASRGDNTLTVTLPSTVTSAEQIAFICVFDFENNTCGLMYTRGMGEKAIANANLLATPAIPANLPVTGQTVNGAIVVSDGVTKTVLKSNWGGNPFELYLNGGYLFSGGSGIPVDWQDLTHNSDYSYTINWDQVLQGNTPTYQTQSGSTNYKAIVGYEV